MPVAVFALLVSTLLILIVVTQIRGLTAGSPPPPLSALLLYVRTVFFVGAFGFSIPQDFSAFFIAHIDFGVGSRSKGLFCLSWEKIMVVVFCSRGYPDGAHTAVSVRDGDDGLPHITPGVGTARSTQ